MRRLTWAIVLLLRAPLFAFEISRPGAIGPAPGFRDGVKLATDGEGFLAIWSDIRGYRFIDTFMVTSAIRGALVDREGQPTTEHDFGIATGSGLFEVASNGDGYLVAYTHWETRFITRFLHVDAQGAVREGGSLPGGIESLTAVRGDYYALIYDYESYSLAIVDGGGKPLRSGIPADVGRYTGPKLFGTSDGRLLMVWWPPTGYGVRAAFLSMDALGDGRIEPVAPPAVLYENRGPTSVVEVRDGIILTWADGDPQTAALDRTGAIRYNVTEAYDVRGRLDVRNAVVLPLADGVVAVDSGAGTHEGWYPDVRDTYGVGMIALDGEGRSTGTFSIFDYDSWSIGAVPRPGGGGVIAYIPRDTDQVIVRNISPSGAIENAVDVSRTLPAQERGAVARCGNAYFVAWAEQTAAGDRVRYRRFDLAGRPLDPPNPGFEDPPGYAGVPRLVCGATSAMLLWHSGAVIFRDGRETAPPVRIAPVTLPFDAVFDGTGYVVNNSGQLERRNERGDVSSAIRSDVTVDALGFNGRELLLAGRDRQNRFIARRLDTAFRPAGPDVVLLERAEVWSPAVAASERMWMIAWVGNGPSPRTIRMDSGGQLLDPVGGVVTGRPVRSLTLSWSGEAFEMLTPGALVTRTPSGAIRTHRFLSQDARLTAIEPVGDRRFLLYSLNDPVHETLQLFGDFFDATAWARPAPRGRRLRD
jgi:hypothetical protein